MPPLILNYTPHPVHIVDGSGNALTVIESHGLARAKRQRVQLGTVRVNGVDIALTRDQYGAVEGLPRERPNVRYIVSKVVARAANHRADLLVPNEVLRDAEGRIIGARSLAPQGA